MNVFAKFDEIPSMIFFFKILRKQNVGGGGGGGGIKNMFSYKETFHDLS